MLCLKLSFQWSQLLKNGKMLFSSLMVETCEGSPNTFENKWHHKVWLTHAFCTVSQKNRSQLVTIRGGVQVGLGRESRELTLRNARKKIEALAHQLCLRRDRIDKAFHFFKLALSANLTRGRKSTHVIAACVYITCRSVWSLTQSYNAGFLQSRIDVESVFIFLQKQ